MPERSEALLESGLLQKLGRLRFNLAGRAGLRAGDTPARRETQPSGFELARHTTYAPGDDLRHLDWSAYARLDQLMIKTFRAERESPITILIDCSESMRFPEEDGKFPFARALAASLAYIALQQCHSVRLVACGGASDDCRATPVFHHVGRWGQACGFLSELRTGGSTRLARAAEYFRRSTRHPCTLVVLSDFLLHVPEFHDTMAGLAACGYSLAAIRPLGPHERLPQLRPGQVRLRDSETGRERLVRITAAALRQYGAALDRHMQSLRHSADANGVRFITVDPTESLEFCLLSELRRGGLLQ